MVMGMEQIDRLGMVAAVEKAIDRVSRDVDGIYPSFDMDAMDPRHAPGVGTPVPAGLTQREAHVACELIGETGKLIGMDMVEVNPSWMCRTRPGRWPWNLSFPPLANGSGMAIKHALVFWCKEARI